MRSSRGFSAMVAVWSLGPLVEALRALRGVDLVSATTFIASTGDLSRFESPRLLMGYLGLVPSEHSSGGTIRRVGITKTGNREARRMLIEAAWSYQYPARIAKEKAEILVRLPKSIRDIAWKAQNRLCARYRSLIARGKSQPLSWPRSRETWPASSGLSARRCALRRQLELSGSTFSGENRAAGHGDPREPLGPESLPTPALSPRQACDDTRSCGSQPAYGSLSDCR